MPHTTTKGSHAAMKILRAPTKSWHSQINKYFLKIAMTEYRSVVAWGRGKRLWGRLNTEGNRNIWMVMVVALLYTFVKTTLKCILKTDDF